MERAAVGWLARLAWHRGWEGAGAWHQQAGTCGSPVRLQSFLAPLQNSLCCTTVTAPQVRRPGVLESVCLDLHLMRGVALQLRNMPEVGAASGWQAALLEGQQGGGHTSPAAAVVA